MKFCFVLALALALSPLVIGCSESSSSDKPGTKTNQFAASDLSPPSDLTVYDKATAAGLIEKRNEDFLATKSSTLLSANNETCEAKARNSIDVSASGDTITVDSNIDMVDCLKEEYGKISGGAGIKIAKAYQSLYVQMSCKGKDMSGYQGKKWADLLPNVVFACENNSYLMNSRYVVEATMDYVGETVDMGSNTLYAYAMPDNSPCSIRRNGTTFIGADGCLEVTTEISEGSNPSRVYSKFTRKSLEWAESNQNTFYALGSMDVTINNWSGTVNFKGARSEPSYSMTSGSETVNGALTLPR